MRATLMYGAGDVRIEDVPDARLIESGDALVRVTRAAVCGSDLWPYKSMEPSETGRRMGHEFIGIVEEVGKDVRTIEKGDLVVSPFLWSDGTCVFCQRGLHSSCLHGGRYGWGDVDGGQGEAVRVPEADGTLVVLPVEEDDALMPSLLALSDVMATGHHAAVGARVCSGKTVAVVGDGAVGLCGVIAAKRLGAARIILLGRRPDRLALAREFGATDIVTERGDEAVERVRELTDGLGVDSALECVGLEEAVITALALAIPGGAVGRVGIPEDETLPGGVPFWKNVSVSGRPSPVRAYIEELLPDVLDGKIEPGARLRPGDRPRRRAGRLPRDERARGDQDHGRALRCHRDPNHVVSASRNPVSVPSPTQATYPSGRIRTAAGAGTWPRTGSSQSSPYSASIADTRSAHRRNHEPRARRGSAGPLGRRGAGRRLAPHRRR